MATIAEETLAARDSFEREHDRTVRVEIEKFRTFAASYLAGTITEDEFRGFRLRYGIYGQRQPGVQMIRCKFPGGILTSKQVMQLARVSDEYGGGRAHLTTRQNIQFHFVPLAQCADAMHLLADEGMTTREACFNTVRNVTGDPLAGLRRNEAFDVRPYTQKVAYAFLRKALTDNLPRKFKIAFSGDPEDSMLGTIHDVGLRAVIKDGRHGFRVLVGGGLGPLPVEAQVLDEFLPVENVVSRIEAVIRVFNKHGNRANRNKARFKFVVKERGFEWVREAIDKEYADILESGGIPTPEQVPEGFGGYQSHPQPLGQGALLPVLDAHSPNHTEYDRWLETNVFEQRQTGYASAVVRVEQGNLTSEQLRGLARLAEDAGDGVVRINIDQNLILSFIPLGRLKAFHAALAQIGLGEGGAREISDVVTCPGAYSCNLALTKSMNLGAALYNAVRHFDDPQVRKLSIKVSGCPNSCGQHWTADFGFYGNARKVAGRDIPYYQMLLGGAHDDTGIMRFGLAVQSIPARLAPEAVKRVVDHYAKDRQAGEKFRDYVLRHKVEFFRNLTSDLAKPPELFPEIYQDWGDDTAFSLQLGRGECAA
ncbi:MAG: nitrite/sulfite reductase [Bryobacterales bacterium]|nr:nitrite/sulfite reductase [Bryobacterales bacterium]